MLSLLEHWALRPSVTLVFYGNCTQHFTPRYYKKRRSRGFPCLLLFDGVLLTTWAFKNSTLRLQEFTLKNIRCQDQQCPFVLCPQSVRPKNLKENEENEENEEIEPEDLKCAVVAARPAYMWQFLLLVMSGTPPQDQWHCILSIVQGCYWYQWPRETETCN